MNLINPLLPAQKLACTVAVITAPGEGASDNDVYHAMITTIGYISLEPLLLSTSVQLSSRTGQAVIKSGKLAVSLLAQEQHDLADRLAELSRNAVYDGGDPLNASGFSMSRFAVTKLPYVADCALALDCTMTNKIDLPQSVLLIFSVDDMVASERHPLIRYNRHYARLDEQLVVASDHYPV